MAQYLSRRICFRLTPVEATEYSPLLTVPYTRTWSELIRSALREYAKTRKATASDNGVRQSAGPVSDKAIAVRRPAGKTTRNGTSPQKKRQKR